MSWDKERIAQIQLPDPADDDPHPRLLLEGRGIHAGEGFTALFPDGWHEITLEVAWEPTGPACWYISTRSEEHTSELQSRFDLVCRLLLEKKKETPPKRSYA